LTPAWRGCDPARPPPLRAGQVHLWLLACDRPHGEDESLLSEAEAGRAASFRTVILRRRFITAHAGLRRILAGYAATPAKDLRLRTGSWGKPYLDGDHHWLRFNLSHSGEHALLAVQRDGEIGADIQAISWPAPMDAARAVCSPEELAALNRDPSGLPQAFFTMWTRKEALAKAIGTGLQADLFCFDVCTGSADARGFLCVGPWRVCSIATAGSYSAAIATRIATPMLLQLKALSPPQAVSPSA
jgi:4'-phosphopantetheinyl transferase